MFGDQNQNTCEPGVADSLPTQLASEVATRSFDERPLVIPLNGGFKLFRLADDAGAKSARRVALGDLVPRPAPHWRVVGEFESTIRKAFEKMGATQKVRQWGAATLPFVAVEACRMVRVLLDQLQSPNRKLITLDRWPANFDETLSQCLTSMDEARQLAARFVRRVVEALWMSCASNPVKPELLQFQRRRGNVWAEWLAGGRVVRRERLDSLASRLTEQAARQTDVDVRRLTAVKRKYEDIGLSTVWDVSPRVAEAVERACHADRCVSLRLCTVPVQRAIPADIWLYLSPRHKGESVGACTLSLHRQHREFILQSADRELFYFPPILLVARLVFVDQAVPRAELPIVRQPRNGFVWNHPYTNCLGSGPFGDAIVHRDGGDPAMATPSQAALRSFPALSERVPVAQERDLCLSGQQETLEKLCGRFERHITLGTTPDLLTLLNGIHDIARLGLTRAHELNQETPRVKLDSSKMPYPVRADALKRALTNRAFPYDPCRPV